MKHVSRPVSDPFRFLEEDHQEIAMHLEKLARSSEGANTMRHEVFAALDNAFGRHAEIEETIVYPVMQDTPSLHDSTLEAFEEHKMAKLVLAELMLLPHGTEKWTAKLSVLKENIEHHVSEEEQTVFPLARKEIDAATQRSMADDIEAFLVREE